MMKIRLVVATILLLLASALVAQNRGPSTSEERAKALKLIRDLEADPLASDARDARQWLTVWLADVPDIAVPVCGEFLRPVLGAKKNYASEIFVQSMYSSAAVVIEDPKANDDNAAKYLAGLEGSLRAYESIRKSKPTVSWPFLDDLIKKRDAGELMAYVREKMPACK